jgi:hypothetical protein
MKKVQKIIALALSVIMLLACLVSCASSGKALMTLEDQSISLNIFKLYLSRMKGNLASSYSFGTSALTSDFWDTVMNVSNGQTYNDYYTSKVLEDTKTYLAALYLFEQRGLKLPKEYEDEIDEEMKRLVKEEADGSKSEFNAMLAAYGVNYKMLREAYIIEAKIAYLRDDLFGSDGSKIASNLVEEYYNNNYRRFKQIFYATYDYAYETDSNGDDIYYDSNGKVAYDVKKGTVKKNEKDEVVKDKNGDAIYVLEDGKTVAYDTVAGKRKNITDSNGNDVTKPMSAEQIKSVIDKANLVMDETVKGDTGLFDALVSDTDVANEDLGMNEYPNGYYMTKSTDYYSPEVVEALFEMEIGEIRTVRSEYGIHIMMRYENEKGGYMLDDNSDFFVSTTGNGYIFMTDLMNTLFSQYLAQYIPNIKVDEALLEGVDMKSVGANYHY